MATARRRAAMIARRTRAAAGTSSHLTGVTSPATLVTPGGIHDVGHR
jgi:hypothetical protein